MQDGLKAVWSIPYDSVAFFPSLKHNFIVYRSSKVSSGPDCIFEILQLWQSCFSRVYSNSCCSCSFEPEIIKIGQSSNKMCSNNILNFQESTIILNACTKDSGNLLTAPPNLLSNQNEENLKWKRKKTRAGFELGSSSIFRMTIPVKPLWTNLQNVFIKSIHQGKNMAQGQVVCWVMLDGIQSFFLLVASAILKNPGWLIVLFFTAYQPLSGHLTPI